MAKQMEAHLQEESKLWSFLVLCQKQIMNARRRNKERNLTWRNSRGQQLLDTFRVLSGVHFMHTICCFEALEVRSLTLQMVCELELKWRSYSHWKPIAPSWKWFVPNWCLSWFMSSWCFLIEGVINKIYNWFDAQPGLLIKNIYKSYDIILA